jgi:hypothetical protein
MFHVTSTPSRTPTGRKERGVFAGKHTLLTTATPFKGSERPGELGSKTNDAFFVELGLPNGDKPFRQFDISQGERQGLADP